MGLDGDENVKDEEQIRSEIAERINKLQLEVDEQMQIRAQASKALGVCESKNEFEGSYERVEFERLLIEAHHKHKYASDEINRLKNMMARGQLDAFKGNQDVKKMHIFFLLVCAAITVMKRFHDFFSIVFYSRFFFSIF